jgi:glutamate--cysteine ligase
MPSLKDWESHLTTIFPEVRLKRYIEMRGADGGPWRNICALPALWVGLLYDADSQAAAYDLISDWSVEDIESLRHGVRCDELIGSNLSYLACRIGYLLPI